MIAEHYVDPRKLPDNARSLVGIERYGEQSHGPQPFTTSVCFTSEEGIRLAKPRAWECQASEDKRACFTTGLRL